MDKPLGFYRTHNMGKFNGQGPDLICISFYKPDRSYGSCYVVEEGAAAKDLEAVRKDWLPLAA